MLVGAAGELKKSAMIGDKLKAYFNSLGLLSTDRT